MPILIGGFGNFLIGLVGLIAGLFPVFLLIILKDFGTKIPI